MRLRRAISLAVLAACGRDAAPPAPAPAPTPIGLISGVVTFAIDGPGHAHPPDDSFTHVSGRACAVRATAATGKTYTATTQPDTGAYALRVPIGAYTLSFAACQDPCCSQTDPTIRVTVAATATATASWQCACSAK